jgi:hypothetical protein
MGKHDDYISVVGEPHYALECILARLTLEEAAVDD